METSPPAAGTSSLNGTQIKALLAAFLGWLFDGLDGYLYVLVALRFVGQLVGQAPTHPETIQKATIIQCVFLIGWAVGGAVFGRVGDRLGRARTLTLTVLTYAVFTGLSFFATAWWHLLIFRFMAALGIGGEWAAGSALVSETLHGKHRAWASALLQSGYMTGCIAASLTAGFMRELDPKWVFVVGVLPAFLTVFVRAAVPEPEGWAKEARSTRVPPVSALFAPGLRSTTLLVSAFMSISLIVSWGFLFFMPDVVRSIPEVKGWTEAQIAQLKTNVTITFFTVNIAANFVATYAAKWFGYRATFLAFMLGGAATFWLGFGQTPSITSIYVVSSLAAFFGLGYFGLYPLYIPPLFPTLVRTLGAGLCYNVGRVASAVGVLFGGQITADLGGVAAVRLLAFFFIPGAILALFMPIPAPDPDE